MHFMIRLRELEADPSRAPLAEIYRILKMPSITGRAIADEARQPSVDVVMRARDQRWNWLGHILGMEGHRLTRQVLLQGVTPTPESILGDVSGLEIQAAINLAKERVE